MAEGGDMADCPLSPNGRGTAEVRWIGLGRASTGINRRSRSGEDPAAGLLEVLQVGPA